VVENRDGQWVRVMGPAELGSCKGDPDTFVARLLG